MRFEELKKGDVFKIDGDFYAADVIGERIVIGTLLEVFGAELGVPISGDLRPVHHPDDLAGDWFITEAFSDLRFNRNNLTDFERQCDEDLAALL